ncbi:MAG: matrixin family metalloprotease [Chitinispirillia bacterium]|jgi:hypothetical protein
MNKLLLLSAISIMSLGILLFGCSRIGNEAITPENDPALAMAKNTKVEADVGPSKGKAVVRIPANAMEVAKNVFFIDAKVVDGNIVEGYAFVHYKDKKGFGKPGCNNNGICEPGEHPKKCGDCSGGSGEDPSSCYEFIANGTKWKSIESYLVDPDNTRGLDASEISSKISECIQKWEDAAGTDILGNEISGTVDHASIGNSINGQNEVIFADIENDGAIAVAIVWGIFGGPPGKRELVEWDMVFDDVDFDWAMDGSPDAMDFESIATHELGHSKGMGDLYEPACSEQTMYGYATEGETKKRDLESGDIAGIKKLY